MKIRTDRLALLAYYLASVPESEFNIVSWYRCGIGWATQIPEFVKLGFKMEGSFPIMPVYRSHKNWLAVENFFGLSHDEAEYLFSMFDYQGTVKPMTVVRRIKRFIKGVEGN